MIPLQSLAPDQADHSRCPINQSFAYSNGQPTAFELAVIFRKSDNCDMRCRSLNSVKLGPGQLLTTLGMTVHASGRDVHALSARTNSVLKSGTLLGHM